MRKKIYNILAVCAAMFCAVTALSAQSKYYPLDTWPYLYEEFAPGSVTTLQGSVVKYDKMNVTAEGKIHYIQKETIMAADMRMLQVATINDDKYINVDDHFMKVVKETEHGSVLLYNEVDKHEMDKVDIGYGKSSLASTQRVSVSALEDGTSLSTGIVNKGLETLRKDRYDGSKLPMKESRYLYVDGTSVKAYKAAVMEFPGVDKNSVKNYIKQNKTKFNDDDSLAELVEFLHNQK